jgi:hypothetical protein
MIDTQQARAQNSAGPLQLYNISSPHDWKLEQGISKYNIATFLAPSINSSNIHPAAIAIYKQNLLLPRSTIKIDEEKLFNRYTFATIEYIYEHFNKTSINTNTTHLSGSVAHQVDFTINGKTISYVWTMKNYNVYGIMFIGKNHNYRNYLPEFNRMKDTFKIPQQ